MASTAPGSIRQFLTHDMCFIFTMMEPPAGETIIYTMWTVVGPVTGNRASELAVELRKTDPRCKGALALSTDQIVARLKAESSPVESEELRPLDPLLSIMRRVAETFGLIPLPGATMPPESRERPERQLDLRTSPVIARVDAGMSLGTLSQALFDNEASR